MNHTAPSNSKNTVAPVFVKFVNKEIAYGIFRAKWKLNCEFLLAITWEKRRSQS